METSRPHRPGLPAAQVRVAAVLAALSLVALPLPSGSAGAPVGATGSRVSGGVEARGREPGRDQDREQPSGAFGFARGEERRYRMGPPGALGQGETATWAIRLEEVREADPARLATFVLGHQYDAPPPRGAASPEGELVTLRSEGRMTVTADGFPVEVRLDVTRDLFALGEESYSLRYGWSGEHFVEQVRTEGQEWEEELAVPGHAHLDRSAPAGLFAWLATGLPCMGREPALDGFERLGTAAYCSSGEWAFANPGLLGTILPSLYEAEGERRFLFFAPVRPSRYGGPRGVVNRGPHAGSTGFGRPPPTGRIARARDPSRHFERARVRFDERVVVEVGDRALDVWRLEIEGPVRAMAVYLDDDDRVVRVDVGPHPVTGKDRWIRLLFPSEF